MPHNNATNSVFEAKKRINTEIIFFTQHHKM